MTDPTPTAPTPKAENLLLDLICNVGLPTAIQPWGSGERGLGPNWGLVVALLFPLAYGLYGDKLFDDYEQRFLKRNVQGELIGRAFSPRYWGDLSSQGWGRSELASQLYDEILFNGATFADLNRGTGPMIMASATDISTGSRFVFNQGTFDVICSDLNAVPLSRAAAASSAVPVVAARLTARPAS